MHARTPTRPPYAPQPVGHQLQLTEIEEAQQGSKVGRFAWFVFGAAFGIFFAFFATGLLTRKRDEIVQFPAPAPIPTHQQAAVNTAPVAPLGAPTPQPQAPRPSPAPPSTQQPFAPLAPPPVVTTPLLAVPTTSASAPPAPVATTKPPAPTRGQRVNSIARRPAAPPPAPAAPKPLPNSGTVSDDDVATSASREKPAPKEKGADVGSVSDLLNAGLNP
jgi:hypothetical protein